jgi:anthranilate synthase component II
MPPAKPKDTKGDQMINLLLIDNYDSFTYNLVHYLEELGANVKVMRNDAKSAQEFIDMGFDAIVLSPGPKSPNEAGACLDIVRLAPQNLPILGVCLGHQTIGQVFGGEILGARAIVHGKVSSIETNSTGLFDGLPKCFNVARYHSLAIEPNSLPDVLQADAITNDGEIMAVSHKTRPIYGVQFHPESIASEYGHEMLNNFVKIAESYKNGTN